MKGKTIKTVEVFLPKIVKADLKFFKKAVSGATIKDVRRRAKLLILELDNNYALAIHLKMSGQLVYIGRRTARYNGQKGKYTHLIYYFTDGSKLIHNDLRQFGYIKLIPSDKLKELLEKKENYGPEPLNKDFTLKVFEGLLKKYPKKRIKPLLMDQTFLAGIGNLYADEILFASGVLPTRPTGQIKPAEVKKFYQNIKKILTLAIKHRGTSADLYIDAQGKKGNFLSKLKIYQREGKKCFRCGTKIKRIKINGRSAFFCPRCQK